LYIPRTIQTQKLGIFTWREFVSPIVPPTLPTLSLSSFLIFSLYFWTSGANFAGILKDEQYDTEGWLSEIIAKQTRLLRLKRYLLLYASFTGLLRSNYPSVLQTIDSLHAFNNTYFPPPPSPDDAIFQNLYTLLVGMQNHMAGFLREALQDYEGITPAAGDTYLLACLGKVVILRGGSPEEQGMAGKILDEVEGRMMRSSPAPQIRSSWFLLKGIASTEVLRSKYPPQTARPHTSRLEAELG
jgi:hypothetical protein